MLLMVVDIPLAVIAAAGVVCTASSLITLTFAFTLAFSKSAS